jgi:uracil-DNA glycosylase family 4
VAYLLGITQVDPIKYGLLFERFISEDRIDVPDIDLDFEDIKAPLVRRHLEEEYGQYNVAGISTFLTMKGRAVVRDVGRVFELPANEIDAFAKSIVAEANDEGIIQGMADNTREGQYFQGLYPKEFGLMTTLEGTIRGAGQHAAGLVLSAKDLRGGENCSLYQRSGALVCNWDMWDCEFQGLIKIDILKLSTLTVLNEAKRLLALRGIEADYNALTLDDEGVFDMLSRGDTSGIFQFSGRALTELCKEMEIDSFEDMAAATALARPGPYGSGMTSLYIKRKHGERWNPLHPIYEEITKDTYGVVVYQEQMLRAMTDLAGLSGSDADQIRKVIGKKRDAKEFEPYRLSFLEGCKAKKTLDEGQAEEFWNGLLEWASYGYNKSHAVEYAMIAYYTAWLKLHYPVEFFCAQLTYGTEKENIVKDVERSGMQVVSPKVGVSDARRWVVKDERLYMPFVEIKGIGESQADKCVNMKPPASGFSLPGFFRSRDLAVVEPKNKLEKLLWEVKAFDLDPAARPEILEDYFQYSFSGKGKELELEVVKKGMIVDPEVYQCRACPLREQAGQVVACSLGMYNVLALGESPGRDEDREGLGFFGDAGKLLWEELAFYGITRRMLHVGNVCKCWPSRTRTPSKSEIKECFNRWMLPEILSMDCRLILAMGNVPLFALTGKDSGILSLSGQVEWVSKVRAWVVWCLHPAAVLRGERGNVAPFREGIEKFAEIFNKETGRIS